MTVQPQFKRGKTYDGRRGRRKYFIEGIISSNGKHVYDVREVPGERRRKLSEDKLLEIARLRAKGGDLVYLSASQFQSFKRCKRKWAFTYIDGEISPGSPATEFGLEVHEAIEKYLKTGEWIGAADAVACAQQGVHMLPTPKDRTIGVEQQLLVKILDGRAMLIGYVDLVEPARNGHPLKVIDHKSTKDFRYAATADDLRDNDQANIYAKWAMEFHRVDMVDAQWRYYCARPSRAKGSTPDGRPRNPRGFKVVSRFKTRGEVESAWSALMKEAETMVDISTNQRVWAKDVEPNPEACGDYGGCPFRHLCDVEIGTIGSLMDHNKTAHTRPSGAKGKEVMGSLMDIINRNKAQQNAAAQAPPLQPEASPPPPPAPPAQIAPAAPAEAVAPARPVSPLMAAVRQAAETRATVAPDPVAEEHAPQSPPTVAELQARDGATGVNPPPVEPVELHPAIEDATKPTIPQTWVDRYRKGHKARSPEEEAWRVEQNQLPEGQRTILAKAAPGDVPPVTEEPDAPEKPDLPIPTASEVVEATLAESNRVFEATPETLAEVPVQEAPPAEPPVTPQNEVTNLNVEDSFGEPTLRLYIDCYPAKGVDHAVPLSELLRPMKNAVQEMKSVPHWNMVKYREGETLLAACVEQSFRQDKPDTDVLVDSFTGEWKACGDILMELADVVIRGGR